MSPFRLQVPALYGLVLDLTLSKNSVLDEPAGSTKLVILLSAT